MSRFYIPDSTSASLTSTPAYSYSNSSDDDDEDNLPYPTELPRKDFLAEDFDPQTYLSSLRNRHQTLEDLRSDLRARSQLLNKELLDLVNGNYEEFLSLGGDLKGGEEKVEGVRVGLLGFEREVEGVRRGVQDRVTETAMLLQEKKQLRKDVVLGRTLLEVHQRLAELEESLGIKAKDSALSPTLSTDPDLDSDDDDVDEDATISPIRNSQRHAQEYILILRLISRTAPAHPFLQAQQSRIQAVRRTLLLDLASSLRQAKQAGVPDAILKLLNVYGDLGAEEDGLRVLRGG